jgi:hypothetical protein
MTCRFGTARRAGMMLPPRGVFAPRTRWRPLSRPPSRGQGRWAGKWGAPQWASYATLRARVIPTGRACPPGHHTRTVLSSTWSLGRSWAWALPPSHSSAWSGHALLYSRSTFCASEVRRREADGAPLLSNRTGRPLPALCTADRAYPRRPGAGRSRIRGDSAFGHKNVRHRSIAPRRYRDDNVKSVSGSCSVGAPPNRTASHLDYNVKRNPSEMSLRKT